MALEGVTGGLTPGRKDVAGPSSAHVLGVTAIGWKQMLRSRTTGGFELLLPAHSVEKLP